MTRAIGGGDVTVTAGVGFTGPDLTPVVELTIETSLGDRAQIMLRPKYARLIGLDLIGAAHSAIADTQLRELARRHGLDGDTLALELLELTTTELPPIVTP